jgi:hypothetical protein
MEHKLKVEKMEHRERAGVPERSFTPNGSLHPVLRLQRTIGNQAVTRMLSRARPAIQAKLTVNQPGDRYEQEADRVADQVMRIPDPVAPAELQASTGGSLGVQRKCSACKAEDEKDEAGDTLSRKQSGDAASIDGAPAPAIVHEVLNSPGQPLDASTRAFFEPRFGYDFSQVRVHTDQAAADSARDVNALAYTVGNHVVFGAGQNMNRSTSGYRLIGHELAHVVQQSSPSDRSPSTAAGMSPLLMRQVAEPEVPEERGPDREEPETETFGAEPPVWRDGVPAEIFQDIEDDWERISRGQAEPVVPGQEPPLAEGRGPTEKYWFGEGKPSWLLLAEIELERPVVTLKRGGTAPNFITSSLPMVHRFYWGGRTFPVQFVPHEMHVLDAIEFEVGQARTQSDLRRILSKYLGFWPDEIVIDLRLPSMFPYFPPDLDKDAAERRREFQKAVNARVKAVPALAEAPSAQARRSRTPKGCRIEHGRPELGGNAIANIYALSFCRFGDPAMGEVRVRVVDEKGLVLDSVQFDGLAGNTAYECKCGYGFVARWYYSRNPRLRERALRYLEQPLEEPAPQGQRGERAGPVEQMLRHIRICRQCGLRYRYVVSNGAFASVLRELYFDVIENPPEVALECQEMSACGKGCNAPPDRDDSGEDLPSPLRF